MEIIYRHDPAVIRLNHQLRFLHLSYEDFPIGETFRSIMEELVRQSLKHKAEAWLIDASQAINLDATDTEWKARYFASILAKAPVSKIARVISPNILYEARLNRLRMEYISTMDLRFFTCELAAMAWLQETADIVPAVNSPNGRFRQQLEPW